MNNINNNNLISRVHKISFSPINPEEFRKYSVCEVTSSDLYDKNKEPKYDGINDPRMGTINTNICCDTCKQEMSECPGHFGHVELATPVYNPLYISKVVIILNIVCSNCSRLLIEPTNLKTLQKTKKDNKISLLYKINSMKQTVKCSHCNFVQSNIRYVKDGMLITKITMNSKPIKSALHNKASPKPSHIPPITKSSHISPAPPPPQIKLMIASMTASMKALSAPVLVPSSTPLSIKSSPTASISSTKSSLTNNNCTTMKHNNRDDINNNHHHNHQNHNNNSHKHNNNRNDINNNNHHHNHTNNAHKHNNKIKFYAENALKILKKIPPDDIKLIGMDSNTCHPSWLIFEVFPVVPPCVRPCINFGCNLRSEDDIVYKLSKLLKANQSLKKKIQSSNTKYLEVYKEQLQWACTTLIDNNIKNIPQSQHRNNGRPLKSLKERIKGKKGRIRDNVIGKRVNNSARTVIDPDPCISVEEVGIPYDICKILTFPEKVNNFTINKLTKLIMNGPNIYPGANYVYQKHNGKIIDLRYKNITKLSNGDIVHRHLLSSDYVLFNRQPSLHKMSMMGHKVFPMNGKSFRLNPAVTGPYNADFDGDEMNVIMPQNTLSMLEISEITAVKEQIISPQSGSPIIGIIMDNILAAYLLTNDDNECYLSEDQLINIALKLPQFNGILPAPTVLNNSNIDSDMNQNINSNNNINNIHPDHITHIRTEKITNNNENTTNNNNNNNKTANKYSGKCVFSMILPPNINMNYHQKNIKIINNKLIKGTLGKPTIGASTGGLIHFICNHYNSSIAAKFIDDLQIVTNRFLQLKGFSVGYDDVKRDKKLQQQTIQIINKAKENVLNYIEETYKKKCKLSMQDFEQNIFNTLNKARDDIGGIVMKNINHNNSFYQMINSKAKGNILNISQILGAVGQQNLQWRGKQGRVPLIVNNRSLPYHHQFDLSASARGFIEHSYSDGLNVQEFFAHMQAGREGVIDTSCKTSDVGYLQRKLIKSLEDIKICYDMTVRNEGNRIIQFAYGGNNIDTTKIVKIKKIGLLELNRDQFLSMYLWKKAEILSIYGSNRSNILNISNTSNGLNNNNTNNNTAQILQNSLKHLLRDEYKHLKYYRGILQYRQKMNEKNLNTTYHTISSQIYQSFDINKIIEQFQTKCNTYAMKDNILFPAYIMQKIHELERIITINPNNNFPFNEINKAGLEITRALIRGNLATKKIIKHDKLTKYQFDQVINTIINKFYSNIIDPGTAVGPIAAQSIGEPCTQLSVAYNTKVQVSGYIIPNPYIGSLIDTYMRLFDNNVITTHITEDNKPSHILHIPREWDLKVPGLNCKSGKIEYKHITAFSRHPPNGKLIKITTKSGKQVVATPAHSFVIKKRKNNHESIEIIRGDCLRIGDLIPIKSA